MINGDVVITAVFVVLLINFARYLTSLRALLVMLREADPLLYKQVNGGNFFTPQGDVSKQKRLFQYIHSQAYEHHHNEAFVAKCKKVRHLFQLSTILFGGLIVTLFAVAFTGL